MAVPRLVAARGAQAVAEERAQAAAAGAELQLQALRRQLEVSGGLGGDGGDPWGQRGPLGGW